MTPAPPNRHPTARELVAARQSQAPSKPPPVPATPPTREIAPATPENYRARYLDEVAPSGIVGRLVKFDKTGAFITSDDGEEIPEASEFVALCDQTVVGWQRFNGPGEPPDKVMGLLYDNFQMPPRESLGDLDPKGWELGLDGKEQDPWQHAQMLVLQNAATQEMYTFTTSSKTGRRAVGNLLKHFDRMQKTNPGELPVVRLRKGSFAHRDERIGMVNVPVFVVCGRQPRDLVATPDTSIGGYLNDEIPHL